ncbi:MAG: glycosyltransferase, partial [Anaerolineales bacterium]
PIVVARHTGVDEMAEREGFGLVAEYGEEAFREVLMDVLNGTGIREAAAQNGPVLYEQRHSWTIMEERLRELYSEL